MTTGYHKDPDAILSRTFPQDVPYEGIVLLRNIEFVSLCEHHMLPFVGRADIAYIPKIGGRIVGISKLARVLDVYAKRLQVQERLTTQIADAIEKALDPDGVAVIIKATHQCMTCRGVEKRNPEMVTSVMRGAFFDDSNARRELTDLIQYGKD